MAFLRKKLEHAIKITDTNKDGLIQRADFELMIKRYKNMGATKEHLERIEATFDMRFKIWGLVDAKTALTYEELASRHMKKAPELAKEAHKNFLEAFTVIDRDGDGKIQFDEWKDHYKVLGINTEYARASFDAMDADHNGVVSKDEFIAYNNEYYNSNEDTLKSSIMYGPMD